MMATAEHISVDGDGNQQREVAGGKEMIRDSRRKSRTHARAEEFEEISKISPVGIYIPTLSV